MKNITIFLKYIKDLTEPKALSLASARKQFYLNLLSNVFYVGVSSIVTLWMTPYLIGYLGIAAYGMIPLTNTIISYASVLTNSLNSAISRFLTIELGKKDHDEANRTFNTALFTLLGFVLLLTPIFILLSINFPNFFKVPPGWENNTRWLFLLISGSFSLAAITSNFAISTFVHSQFVVRNLINLGDLLIRVVLLVLLYTLLPTRLWYAGVAVLTGSIISLIGFYYSWKHYTPEITIRARSYDRAKLGDLSQMGGWVIVNTLGTMLLGRVDLIVVNMYLGATITGGYASVIQFNVFLEYLMFSADMVVRPALLLKYAQQDFDGLRELALRAIKIFGLVLALPVGFLCGFSRPILSVWLGPEYQYLSTLMVLLTGYHVLCLAVRPLLRVHEAYNKVRIPGIVTLISGVVGLLLALAMVNFTGLGENGIAIAVASAWIVRNAIFIPLYTAHIMHLKWWTFFQSHLLIILATLFSGLTSLQLSHWFFPVNWFQLGSAAIIISVLYLIILWLIGFNKSDRQFLMGLLPWKK